MNLVVLRAACAFLLGTGLAAGAQQPVTPGATVVTPVASGSISGVVKDVNGVVISGAHIVLSSDASPALHDADSDSDGRFTFSGVAVGSFKLTVSEDGLETKVVSDTVRAGEDLQEPNILLRIATANTNVDVTMTQHEVAEVDVKLEEKQNILGFLPNYYVAYNWDAAPLDAKQKFELANRSLIAPFNIPFTAAIAGIEQWTNALPGYGRGPTGYGKRFGSIYADSAIGTELGGAILPTIFKEDPRYFYKGTGSIVSRTLYAASTSVVGRTDQGKRRISFSSILGDFGAGAIANLYYPPGSRSGASVTLENGAIGLASDSVGNIIQEFLIRHLTPRLPPAESK